MPETPRRMGNEGKGKCGISRRLDIPRLVPPNRRALRGLVVGLRCINGWPGGENNHRRDRRGRRDDWGERPLGTTSAFSAVNTSPQSGLDEPVNLGNPYPTSCAIVTDVVVHQAGCRSIRPLFSVEKAL